jgi:hypothetical protein
LSGNSQQNLIGIYGNKGVPSKSNVQEDMVWSVGWTMMVHSGFMVDLAMTNVMKCQKIAQFVGLVQNTW